MPYRLFLYKPAFCHDEYALEERINKINSALQDNYECLLQDETATPFLARIKSDLGAAKVEMIDQEVKLCFQEETSKFARGTVYIKKADDRKAVFFISMPYLTAALTLAALKLIALRYRLVIYDPQTQDYQSNNHNYNKNCVVMTNRAQDLNRRILKRELRVRNLLLLEQYPNRRVLPQDKFARISYCLVLKYDKHFTFEQRVADFDKLLQASLCKDETLVYENRCFLIRGQQYQITYCLEGYKGNGDLVGYIKNGQAAVEHLHHLSMRKAFDALRWLKPKAKEQIFEWMDLYEQRMNYPNPASRLAHCFKLYLWFYKYDLGISYGSSGREFNFVPVQDKETSWSRYGSILSLDPCPASFIQTVISDFCPDVWDKYYEDLYFGIEAATQIMKRIVEIKRLILRDPFDPRLRPYLDGIVECYELHRNDPYTAADYKQAKAELSFYRPNMVFTEENIISQARRIRASQYAGEATVKAVASHRKEVAHLYDIFLYWLNTVIKSRPDCLIRLTGP